MLLKNAIQKIHVYAYDSTTGAAKTGDAAQITGYVSLDGTANAIDDTNPAEVDSTNMPGIYVFELTAAETNCDSFALHAKSSTSNIRLEPIVGFTTAGTAAAVSAVVPDGQKVDVNTIKTKAVTVDAGGTTFPASIHASGAAVAKSPATLATADVSGNLPANLEAVKTTALGAEGTAGDMAAALSKLLNVAVASQALTVASVNQTGDAYADTQTLLTRIADAYEAILSYEVHDSTPADEFTVIWYKNGIAQPTGVSVVKINIVKRSDGTDLIAETSMTQVGATSVWKYDEPTNRLTPGIAYTAILKATIDAVVRTVTTLVGRDG